MDKSKFLSLARKFNSVLFEDNGLLAGALPLVVAGRTVGLVRAELLPLLRQAAEFRVSEAAVTLDPALETPDARSDAVARLLLKWRETAGLTALKGWRGECYDVKAEFCSPALLRMERSATSVFGIRQYGVDLNGYTRHPERGFCVWIQRRSQNKPTWPGKLDNMVSGGLTSGLGVLEAVQKEAWEEAGLPEHLLPGIRAAGVVSRVTRIPGSGSICYQSARGLFPNTELVFDLEVPPDWRPQPQDGEVDEFLLTPVQVSRCHGLYRFAYNTGHSLYASHAFVFDIEVPAGWRPEPQDGEVDEFSLVTAEELMELVCSDEFKTTSAPVTLDFLVRHGFITPSNEPHYLELCELLHVPLQGVYNSGRLLDTLRQT